MTPPVVPALHDGTVTLRAHAEGDIPRMIEFANDPRARLGIRLPSPYGQAEARAWLDAVREGWTSGQRREWAVEVDGRFAGSVGIRADPGGRGELGFGLHPDVRGRGIATRAARLALTHVFDTDDARLDVVLWRSRADDLASWRVAWALGFHLDGTRRMMHVDTEGRLADERVATLLRGEPMTPRHPWWEPKLLLGERIRLRPWRADDAPAEGPDEVAQQLLHGAAPPGPETFARWRADREQGMSVGALVEWCIADAESDEPLGSVQVSRLDEAFTRGTGWLGSWLHREARGRGVIADALDLLVPHAFAPRDDDAGLAGGLGLRRLHAGTDEQNRASRRALRRAGFREVSRERAAIAHDDRPATGAISFELLATDDRVSQAVEPADIPVLETERLRLRPWRPDDAPPLDDELDRDSLRFMPAGVQPTARTFADWLARRGALIDAGDYLWCLADRATDAPLGMIQVFQIGKDAPGSAEVGYWLYVPHRGHGYVGEALTAVIEFAFAPVADGGLGLHRLHAGTDAENIGSHRILVGAGFREWGHDHQAYARADGSLSDGRYFELLAADDTGRAEVGAPTLT